MAEEIGAERVESGGVALATTAREALERTGTWANRTGVFICGTALVSLLCGALMLWRIEKAMRFLKGIHTVPGSRAAHLVASYLQGFNIYQVFLFVAVILGAVFGGLMGWLALRFGLRLNRIKYGATGEAFIAATQAQRAFWRTLGVLIICAIGLSIAAGIATGIVMVVFAASHMRH